MKDMLSFILGLACICALYAIAIRAVAQDVEYCLNPQTGDIVAVEPTMPCPMGYYKL